MENAYEWYTSGPRQRLQPGGKIVCVMTRWSTKDLTGMLLSHQKEAKADQWEVIEFPAIMDHGSGIEPVWPEYWSADELERLERHYLLQNGTHNGCKIQLLKKEQL